MNIVPSNVRVELYVRAKSMDVLVEINKKVNRALEAGAIAIGCNIEIEELPGYMPMISNNLMARVFSNNVSEIVGTENVDEAHFHTAGSSDVGDVTQVIPGTQLVAGGFEGGLHARDFKVVDKEMAYIIPAKIMGMTIVDLLSEKAYLAKQISKEKKGSKEKYLNEIKNMKK